MCEYLVADDRYSLYHGQSVYRQDGEQCFECSCSDGVMECEFEDDEDCGRGNSRTRGSSRSQGSSSRGRYSCEYQGEELGDGESINVDCNVCRCRRGRVSCTRRPCPGQTECRMMCRNATGGPVCGPGAVTFPSRCVANCFGVKDSELIDGPCSNRVSKQFTLAHHRISSVNPSCASLHLRLCTVAFSPLEPMYEVPLPRRILLHCP